MKPLYCQWCVSPLDERCGCLSEIAEAEKQFIEDYENDPMVQYGWRQQDLIEFGHFNQR